MIPKFPTFKNLELTDKEGVTSFTDIFKPYSDFNFTSLWLWDITKTMLISQLNGNLVIHFHDYVYSKTFLSFIGDKLISETTRTLLNFSKKEFQTDFLKLIPEEIYKNLPNSEFLVIADKDSYDYIYYIPDMVNENILNHNSFGRGIKSFLKSHPDYTVEEYLIQDAPRDKCLKLFETWAINKKIDNYFDLNEYRAFQRLFDLKNDSVRFICLFVNGNLVGLTVYEILPNNFVMSHFAKGNIDYHKSINDILNWEEAKNLNSKNLQHFNWEQDLGILGLRQSKLKYKPCFFLEKSIVKFTR